MKPLFFVMHPFTCLIVFIADYGHTKDKSLILCSPNSNPNPISVFGMYLDIKAEFFVEIIVEQWKTWIRDSQYQMGADSSAGNTVNP